MHRTHLGRTATGFANPTIEVERKRVLHVIKDHFAAGQLDPVELDAQLDRALQARTRDELGGYRLGCT